MNHYYFKTTLLLLFTSVFVFSQPKTGYYDAAVGKADAQLRSALNNIIKDPNVTSYSGLWSAYKTTDINPATGKIWDMYSNCSFTWSVDQNSGYTGPECTNYNREHSIPQSWFGSSAPMVSDAFHVYPTDSKVNGIRSNYPFGEVGNATTITGNGSKLGDSDFPGYSQTVFEPIDEYKGDFARTYFYMATCYAGKCETWSGGVFGNTYLGLTAYAKELFLKWHRQDPVSSKETNRNNAVEDVQDNRNPFIDYPMFAEHIWGSKKGTTWSFTSGVDALRIIFDVSPVPATNVLNITTDEPEFVCTVISMNGQILSVNHLTSPATIDISGLNNGMYLLQLEIGNRRNISKFTISR